VSGRRVQAVIIAVGSEMLTPERSDTNSLFITSVLNDLGIGVAYKTIVGDDRREIDAQLGLALSRHPVVILTGGLGPTDDDLTRDVVAAHLGLPVEEDAAIVETIRTRFAARGMAMPEVNRRQAQVPRGATVLANPRGSAPGLLIEHDGRVVALLPGPPRELQPMMSTLVRDRLAEVAGGIRLLRRLLKVCGRSESRLEEVIQPTYSRWLAQTPAIETTILATPGHIELHLSTQTDDDRAGTAAIDRATDALAALLGPDLISRDGRSIEQVVGAMLIDRGFHIALAESCTGGLATSRLTDVPGSSSYVDRAVVAYSNEAKMDLLGVPGEVLSSEGAVSEPVARLMAEGVRRRSGADIGVGITGVAGPGGGSDVKPVGTVWIAVAGPAPGGTRAAECRFPGGRELIKTFGAVTALDLVRRWLIDAPWDLDWIRRT
jgi:nicotinamide-nucleotide amidase